MPVVKNQWIPVYDIHISVAATLSSLWAYLLHQLFVPYSTQWTKPASVESLWCLSYITRSRHCPILQHWTATYSRLISLCEDLSLYFRKLSLSLVLYYIYIYICTQYTKLPLVTSFYTFSLFMTARHVLCNLSIWQSSPDNILRWVHCTWCLSLKTWLIILVLKTKTFRLHSLEL